MAESIVVDCVGVEQFERADLPFALERAGAADDGFGLGLG